MPRGGKRAGAGRKHRSPDAEPPEVGTLVYLPRVTREALEALRSQNDVSINKQARRLLIDALEAPEWVGKANLEGWRGKHQFAFGRIVAHAAGRIEAVLGMTPTKNYEQQWCTDLFAALAVQSFLAQFMDDLVQRLSARSPSEQLSSETIINTKSLGTEVARNIVRELDSASEKLSGPLMARAVPKSRKLPSTKSREFERPVINGGAQKLMFDVARDMSWRFLASEARDRCDGRSDRYAQPRPEVWPRSCPKCNKVFSDGEAVDDAIVGLDACTERKCPMLDRAMVEK